MDIPLFHSINLDEMNRERERHDKRNIFMNFCQTILRDCVFEQKATRHQIKKNHQQNTQCQGVFTLFALLITILERLYSSDDVDGYLEVKFK